MIEGEERSPGAGAPDDAPPPSAAERDDIQPMEQEQTREDDGGPVD